MIQLVVSNLNLFPKLYTTFAIYLISIKNYLDKLARNRESARNSRKRKRVYVELLEKKVEKIKIFLNKIYFLKNKRQLSSLIFYVNYKKLMKTVKNYSRISLIN
jgi:hypothetical protein